MDEKELDYESLPESAPLSYQLIAGAFAGVMEHTIMFPIDAIKTRMQAAGNSTAGKFNKISPNMLAYISKISTTEGSFALWKGVQSVILGAGPAHAVYFATYEVCKAHLIDPEDVHTHQPLKTAVSGMVATIAADALMNPFDTIKQRLQLHPNDSMFRCAVRIYQNEGLAAFHYSYPTTLAMNIPFAAINFVIYESTTKFLNPQNTYSPWIHCLCGGISGATCAAITTPLDCIKTVLQVRGSDVVDKQIFRDANTFKKAASAIYQTYRWKGFFRGLKPRVISNMPATAISWTSYEFAKHFLFSWTP
ncbi:HBR227Cp [Eremothecium sinecaudum]|uniref:HBR227Cp n=1 Tax=Eremothecium sinecaudum TaxID=45286 RepID=A0A109UX16_9SACH|nr:HBR227Cp [Eremothecium sinecaudum]AMD19128.1 HBR227Cp [Eremothecium sinecaudum]